MKKLFLITITVFTLQLHAQKPNHKGKKDFLKDLSVEQVANLKTKKMVLLLDLTNSQQDKIYNLNLDLAKNRKAKMAEREKNGDKKPSKDIHYQNTMERLDKQIAMKKKMKSILNEKQYEKWEKTQMHKKRKRKRQHRRTK